MRTTLTAILALAGSLHACMPSRPPPDPKTACQAEVQKKLLNPETAEFHDFTEVDAGAFKAAVIPPLEAEHNYPAGKMIVEGEIGSIDKAAHLYRMRVRADGQLGNKVTKLAFCRQPIDGQNLCFCTLLD